MHLAVVVNALKRSAASAVGKGEEKEGFSVGSQLLLTGREFFPPYTVYSRCLSC